MADDAGHPEEMLWTRRPGSKILTAIAVLLLLGGGTAVAVGVLDQDANPPAPRVQESSTPRVQESSAPRVQESSVPAPKLPTAAALPEPAHATPRPSKNATTRAHSPLPASVSIPAIDVQSELITVGLKPDGSLEVPQPGPDYDKAAWFEGSPRPGDVGPATIEGHVDSAKNGPSVFYKLGTLEVGDQIVVTRKDGSVATFVVYQVDAYPKDDFPTRKVYGNTAGHELRLITCGGPFDSAAGSYVNNTVVFARTASRQ